MLYCHDIFLQGQVHVMLGSSISIFLLAINTYILAMCIVRGGGEGNEIEQRRTRTSMVEATEQQEYSIDCAAKCSVLEHSVDSSSQFF